VIFSGLASTGSLSADWRDDALLRALLPQS
jgi:hypothetical protein